MIFVGMDIVSTARGVIMLEFFSEQKILKISSRTEWYISPHFLHNIGKWARGRGSTSEYLVDFNFNAILKKRKKVIICQHESLMLRHTV